MLFEMLFLNDRLTFLKAVRVTFDYHLSDFLNMKLTAFWIECDSFLKLCSKV